MDKGIRPYCNAKFVELNEQRRRGLIANTPFRKAVIADVMEQFGITLASAATHYNHAFHTVRELNAELVSGLGRAPDKNNGGRKKKVAVVAGPTLLLTYTPPVVESTLISEGVKENTSVQTVTINPPAAPALYTVRKASTGEVVAEGVSIETAEKLVAKAVSAKKAKLVYA